MRLSMMCGISLAFFLPSIIHGKKRFGHTLGSTTTAVSDFCQPCVDGSQCNSGFCVMPDPNNSNGICSQGCAANVQGCPDGFDCAQVDVGTEIVAVCNPPNAQSCNTIWQGVSLNDTCIYPGNGTDPNSSYTLPCVEGLVCFMFGSGVGACVQGCDEYTPCALDYQCCYSQDTNDACVTVPSSNFYGGCFKQRVLGDACVLANESMCNEGQICYTPDDAASNYVCYDVCNQDGGCSVGEECVDQVYSVNGNDLPLCCAISSYTASNPYSCVPYPAPCLVDLGVTCSDNAACLSGYCLSTNQTAYCSTPCVDDSNCASLLGDSNTALTTCQTIENQNYCLTSTAAALPKCALSYEQISTNNSQSCGGCHSGEAPMGGLVLALWRLTRRRRQPR